MEPDKDKDETVNVSFNNETSAEVDKILAGDLITARECGYHTGYMRALRDAAMIIFACVMISLTIEAALRRE